MDPATAIARSKENIQPLRYGRNATQLGTALRAQEDADAQQLLLQEKQMYEAAIKNYEGDDPLENWYEYILWVEQSYPKSGHESHIGKLLQQCLAMFEKEVKYHQDRRYIRLWINYISMQKNPLELYQLLYNNGIGTMVADMYRAWAFELEQIEDYKRADKVYLMGLSAKAEPQDELDYAHKNFQLAVARITLGHTDDRNERSLLEQRQAFSSLRAIKAGRKVGSVRIGHRVREHYPGIVPQIPSVMHNPNSRIPIYQDDVPGDMKSTSILDHVPVEDTIHKENTIKPGPWNGNGNKRCPLITSVTKSSFKVHEDQLDEFDGGKLRLFPNHTYFFDGSKYPEYLTVPVFVPDAPNPNIILRPHYPKDLVYANTMDISMEEVRAQRYLQRAQAVEKRNETHDIRETEQQVHHNSYEAEQQRHNISLQEMLRQRQELSERHKKLQQQQREAEQFELDRQRLQAEQERLQIQQYEAENLALENQRREAEQRELERLEVERMEAERLEAERLEAQRIEAELNSQHKLQASSFMHHHHTSSLSTEPEEHLLGQSLTVNTKEAVSAVQDMWRSPDTGPAGLSFRSTMTPRIPDSKLLKLGFDIHMDSSMTQHAMSSSKHHSGYNVQPYNDQENHQNYSVHQSYSNQEHQTSYSSALHNTYQYQMQQHHEQRVQPSHSRSHHSQHHQQLMQTHQQAHVMAHHQSLSHPSHLQSHSQIQHHQTHHQPHQASPNQHLHHQSHQHMQHMQHAVYGSMTPNDIPYQQYPTQLDSPLLQQNVEPPKQLHYSPYHEPDIETSKPYRMPPELPYIKSPGMNRRDIKYLEGAEDKENAIVVDYNGPMEDNMTSKPAEENNLYIDESLGISPLSGNNDTCFTEAFNTQLTSSTPMTNHFKQSYKGVEGAPQYSNQCTGPQPNSEAPNGEGEEKLSVILESTREYISSSSGSSAHTRTAAALGFTLTKEDLVPIKEQGESEEGADVPLFASQPYEPKMQAQIQAVHAQSPRTVQRNVDQITSEIKKNCDLRKSINFKLNEIEEQEKVDTMECEEHLEPMEQAEEEVFEFPSGDINPFDKILIAGLLKKIKFPQPHHAEGYVRLDTNLNKFVPSTMVMLGNEAYDLEKCLGKGMYGTVFKAVNLQTGQTVALKTQKPAWIWEFYITREIKARLTNPHVLRGFMDVSMAYVANNSSVLVSEYSKFGTLLAVTNQIKIATGKPLVEHLAIFFTIEMLQIVEYLHKCQIIHGDIKPDNFLLMRLPTEDVRPTIQLIDFGCSIDMSLLPEKTTFTQVIKTEDFTCIEMQTGRPWTYQTDLYCLAATSHCLLFGNYMRVSNVGGRWFITSKIPRYMKKPAWEQFFTELLNIESCEKMPDLSKLRNMMEESLAQMPDVQQKIRNFVNILNKR
ncbi:Mitotic checkpoint serine/threonine-protein kinase BUB1 [Dufourea novaeangliae]|uniref:Mitotic checkpoint serine/threonine-protein kinase BUB1 n=1 Tax=Dufourea novaeangliae TaxID=178035 RepID=A0A154PM05_DUFNO|nr:Mitotic checkpoint serine/threonine-protein kinase BUB1 [Dufourea novaeangliae]